jgi:hypothetical protein
MGAFMVLVIFQNLGLKPQRESYFSEPGIEAAERERERERETEKTEKGRTRNPNLAPRGFRFIL